MRRLGLALLITTTACFDPNDSGDDGTATAPTTSGEDSTGESSDDATDPDATVTEPSSSSASVSESSETSAETTVSTESTGTTEPSSSSEGSSSEETNGDSSSTTAACEPITDDPSAIGMDCLSDADCPEFYTCQDNVGIVLQQLCAIICEEDCECPEDHTCTMHQDKAMMPWFQCDPS